ncbi:DUF3575 domain-containing protein [Chryseobacterium caseinilyticum]|uniref:DUF3575 domain-containing protein n=1 Tax=Chryseobacterium caseinilyticum TaxID=2771428 RepID=A0ABR8ZIR2_9FLAO|nr:DUF3575 domain-containing protein [Chryseobacterium caseinilyticum]MBD8084626.1 DUF3575 domain-containing protein [Chryseobacterium caseinilyticum]
MKTRIAFLMLIFQTLMMNAQTEVKANTIFLPLGIVNVASEQTLNKNFTLQEEVFISPWKSFSGKHLQIYMATLEGRYYFKESMKKWYVGGYFSFANFNLQKWNYWNELVVLDENEQPQILADGSVRRSEIYQKGYSFIFGISGGYHFTINEKLGLDIFAGVGSSQGMYKGFYKDNGQRSDKAHGWNKSGELIPTRGGLMLTYKL